MQSIHCSNCGAEVGAEARFCRRCGQPTFTLNQTSVTEATTQILETPAERETQTHFHSQPTSPAYLAPGATPFLSNTTSKSLKPVGQKRRLMLAGLIAVVLVTLVSFTAVIGLWLARHAPRRIIVSGTEAPKMPELPEPPEPLESSETSASGDTVISSALIYPGAETTMNMIDGRRGGVLHLRTSDPLDKVVDWYEAKLKPGKSIKIPGANAVLRAGKLTAVITAVGTGTNIIIKQDVNR